MRRRVTVPCSGGAGSQDKITPPEVSWNRLPGLLRRARHVVIPDGPHAIIWTHADEVNRALLGFIGTLLPAITGAAGAPAPVVPDWRQAVALTALTMTRVTNPGLEIMDRCGAPKAMVM